MEVLRDGREFDGSRTERSAELTRTRIFELLQNVRRRYAFHFLRQQNNVATLGELSDQVAAWEQGKSIEDVTTEERQRVYVSFLQTHLARMEEAGVLDYDEETKRVELTEQASQLDVYLEVVTEDDIPWAEYYLGLTGISTAYLVLVWLEIPPFAGFAEIVWVVILALFGLSALYHHRYLKHRKLGRKGAAPS